jgi:sterol desaturase/sphingolipid hydroxylase (fatty acid hydroxylase superfamily)
MLILHDAYFYWTHRMMHMPAIFRWMHWEHHKSQKPTPWTAYSFSIPEGLVQGLFVPLYVMTMPGVTGPAVIAFLVVEILHNTAIHSGLELFPRRLVSHPVFGWLAGATHHDIHHGTSSCNYGLYFRFWDRMMGTEHRQFVPIYEYIRSPANDGRGFRLLSAQAETGAAPEAANPVIDF